jgi:hypothetical protein
MNLSPDEICLLHKALDLVCEARISDFDQAQGCSDLVSQNVPCEQLKMSKG